MQHLVWVLVVVLLLMRGIMGFKIKATRFESCTGRCIMRRIASYRGPQMLAVVANYAEVIVCKAEQHRNALQMLADMRRNVTLIFIDKSISAGDEPLHCVWSAFRNGIHIESVVLEDLYLGKSRLSDEEIVSSWNDKIHAKMAYPYFNKVSYGDGGALQRELDVAVTIVQRASYMTRSLQTKLRGSLSDSTSSKADLSPVTVADFAAQALIVSYLAEQFPDDAFIAEEDSSIVRSDSTLCTQVLLILEAVTSRSWLAADLFEALDRAAVTSYGGVSSATQRRTWVLDPIDGTKGFLRGQHFCIGLGLLIDNEAKLSVLGCPNLNIYRSLQGSSYDSNPVDYVDTLLAVENVDADYQLYHEHSGSIFFAVTGCGAFARSLSMPIGAAFEIATSQKQTDISLCESAEISFGNRRLTSQIASSLGVANNFIRIDGMCKHCLVACGAAEATLRLPPRGYIEKIWDHVAGDHLVREAGGSCTDLRGLALDYSGGKELDAGVDGVVASNGILHSSLLQAVRFFKQ